MISVEFFKPEKHYEEVARWWREQKWPVMPLSHLSQTGVIVSSQGKLAAAAWIYKTDSALCWLDFIVANPEIRRDERSSALSVLISTSKMICRTMGFQSIFMTIKNESLGKRIEAHDFKATDHGMVNYLCDISGR